jgi:hypothetical protein
MFELSLKSLRRTLAFSAMLAVVAAFAPGPAGAAGDKELERVSGTVGYQLADSGPFNNVIGTLPLPDKAFAVTQTSSAAILRMPDSSEIGLGQNTKVQLAAFNDIRSGPGTQITVNGGALKFDIRHPAGKKANYKFITPTSQIAVRGTIGLIAVVGAGSTSTTTIACVSGTFTATVGSTTVSLAAGQAISVVGGSVTTTSLGSVVSGFQSAGISSPTGAGAGVGAGAAGGVSGGGVGGAGGAASAGTGAGAGSVGAIAGGAGAATIGAVAATGTTKTNPTPAPTPAPTSAPTAVPTTAPGLTLSLGGTALGAQNQLFASSVPQSASAGVSGPSGTIGISTTGAVSADQSTVTGPNAVFNLLINAFGNGTLSATAAGATTTAAFSIYGPLVVSPTTVSFTGVNPSQCSTGGSTCTFTVQQSGPPGGTIAVRDPSCQTGYGATVSANSAPIGSTATTITVTATQVGAASNSAGCTIAINGQAAQSVTVSVNISSTSIIINGQRRALPSTRSPL